MRKYLGLLAGVLLTLVVSATAYASTIGPNTITNAPVGWNSPIYTATTTSFSIQSCTSSSGTLYFDWMHHWPLIPSTGTAEKALTCANNTTWRTASWSGGSADYSVEYTQRNSATISLTYKIVY